MKLDEYGFIDSKLLPDGTLLAIHPLTFDRARLTVGRGYLCYETAW